jgi:Fe-S cluster assembly protein SufD
MLAKSTTSGPWPRGTTRPVGGVGMTTSASRAIAEQTIRDVSREQNEPEWLLRRRLEAWRSFEAMAMPTGMEEEWRRTDISGIDLDAALAGRAPARGRFTLPGDLTDESGLAGLLVSEDGRITSGRAPGDGVVFSDLANAAREHASLVEEHLHGVVLPTEWKLQALQAAMWSGGAFVYVPRGREVELPLRLVTTASSAGASLFPHVLIVADEGSAVTVIQESVSPEGDVQSLVSGAVEIVARRDARVRYFDIQGWGGSTYSFQTVRARLESGASFTNAMVGLGGRLTRAKVEALLQGAGSSTELIGVSFGDRNQHFDYNTLQDHIAPHTTSDLLYKAALTDKASEVWYGTVRIHKGATASDANQTSRNLLLSDTSKAAPIPVLEIEQYDILRCSHGATAGPLDEDALFYLQSRGIPHAEAESLLVEAFFTQVLDRIPDAALRSRVEEALQAKLARTRQK